MRPSDGRGVPGAATCPAIECRVLLRGAVPSLAQRSPLFHELSAPASAAPEPSSRDGAVVGDVINAGCAVGGALADLHACGARSATVGPLLALGTTASTFATRVGFPLEGRASLPNTL
jgi:hypothetical protein